jgi:membrane-associated phospholipid phosphatase
MATVGAPRGQVMTPRHGKRDKGVRHGGYIVWEVVLAILIVALAVAVKDHPAPLPGDAGVSVAWQHLLLPHHALASAVEDVSTVAWPVPQAVVLAAVTLVLLALRRWLAALLALVTAGIADGSNYLIAEVIRRPRPNGYGVRVLNHIAHYYSFPSGHVVHAFAYFGFLLFLTLIIPRAFRRAPWLWPVSLVLMALIVLMGPSRLLEGEHWPSDVLGGALYGLFWLVIAIHVYRWAATRWPPLAEHAAPGS